MTTLQLLRHALNVTLESYRLTGDPKALADAAKIAYSAEMMERKEASASSLPGSFYS